MWKVFLRQRNRNAESLTTVEAVCEIPAQTWHSYHCSGSWRLAAAPGAETNGTFGFIPTIPLLLCRD